MADPWNDDIGYGKPPKKHQFQKGQSGNAKGRPKKPPSLHDLFAREAARLITITEGSQKAKVTQLEFVIRRTFRDAMQGNLHAARLVLQGMQAIPDAPEQEQPISEHDLQLLRQLLADEGDQA